MAFRFHRSRSILPGVRLNLSKSGPSLSLGPQGARLNIGPQGLRTTVGIPGTGISHITRKSWNSVPTTGQAHSIQMSDIDMSGMSEEESRTLFVQLLAASSLTEVKRQRKAFDAYVKNHPGEGTEEQIAVMHQLYTDEIARKSIPKLQGRSQIGAGVDGPEIRESRFDRALLFMLKLTFQAFAVLVLGIIGLIVLILIGVIK